MLNREKLFGRLAPMAYATLVEATRQCKAHQHGVVELEHWLYAMLNRERSDLPCVLAHYGASTVRTLAAIEKALARFPTSCSPVHDIAPRVEQAVERGMLVSQMLEPGSRVRTVHILAGLLQIPECQRQLYRISKEFEKISLPGFFDDLPTTIRLSNEDPGDAAEVPKGMDDAPEPADGLLAFCTDLTEEARAGRIDPVVGREGELRQVVDIILRRRQNNPFLVGEAGVGKTAVAEAMALAMVSGQVPPSLAGARLLSLDLGRLQAGASARGEFEGRLTSLLDAIKASTQPIILFCDEAHTLIGAGGNAGTGDAVNLLKPMLARGQLRMIAATTWSEYKQFIEPDAALTRRFQPVAIDEPGEAVACDMLRSIAGKFAAHHGVVIRDTAIDAAVRLSSRHLPARQLPDKAIGLLDTACARVAQGHHSRPLELQNRDATLSALRLHHAALAVDRQYDLVDDAAVAAIELAIDRECVAIEQLEERLARERTLAGQLIAADAAEDTPERRAQLLGALAQEQADGALVSPWVDAQAIARVLADWTGIPVGKMLVDDIDHVLDLERSLASRVFGQAHATGILAKSVRIARSGLRPPGQPLGIFMLAGPTGTGKTAAAMALADAVVGGEHNMITLNMTEFQESHTASTLKGAPPGYVGYGRGGKLTEAVRRKPHAVILLDEFDKAHRDVHDLFYQVFDKGWMEDGEGRHISFRQSFIVLTTNLGADEIEAALRLQPDISPRALQKVAHESLARSFPPALLARMQVIPFAPLDLAALTRIAARKLADLGQLMMNESAISLECGDGVDAWIAERVVSRPNAGRAIAELLDEAVLPELSQELLTRKRNDIPLATVTLCRGDDSLFAEYL